MQPARMYGKPDGLFVFDLICRAASQYGGHTAIVDTSYDPPLHISYADYVARVRSVARSLVAAGVRPGNTVAIFLPNCWEFCVAFHAIEMIGAIPTPLNPSYKEREVHYQLEISEAVALITDGALIRDMTVGGLKSPGRIYTTRNRIAGTESFLSLLRPSNATVPKPQDDPRVAVAALPFSSGTTGLPKGVMLSHSNLVANVFQTLGDRSAPVFRRDDNVLCFLPMYHIYGMNVVLNPVLTVGATLVLMPRFDLDRALHNIAELQITCMPCVPPVLNAFCVAAEQGRFPTDHMVEWVKCGAAPLGPELARRFESLTGIRIRQGYGMTEASPVTHLGSLDPELYNPPSIGLPVAETDCSVLNEDSREAAVDECGELVMRGPQFMLGYWKDPAATDAVMRNGCFHSGDIVRRDERGFFYVVDRKKEMIKYNGFPVAPAEVEAVLLEHPSVRDCGVVGRTDASAGEIPCAFVVLREGGPGSEKLGKELASFVAERLTGYKQPRDVVFVASIPRNPSGKILRRELRRLL